MGKKGKSRPQNHPQRQRRRGNGRRSTATKVQAQGVGGVPMRAWGSRGGVGRHVWNAFHSSHLPLPRAVGPYTVVRTTRLITSSDAVMVFGTFADAAQVQDATGPAGFTWSQVCAVGSVDAGLPVQAASNTRIYQSNFPGVSGFSGSGMTLVPSAVSVQVMNPTALSSADGVFAAGVCTTQAQFGGRASTWSTFASEFIAYMRPRLLSGGKLALRGVQMDSYPLNMDAISAFAPMADTPNDSNITWSSSSSFGTYGWAPMVVFNQSVKSITYIVTTEWRVRFDFSSVAAASHTYHPVATDATWDRLCRMAVSAAPGVIDIVEKVANSGIAGRAALALTG